MPDSVGMIGAQGDASPVKAANLGLKFLLELCALAGLAIGGASTGSSPVNVVLAIGMPLVAAVIWGLYAAPKSSRRLPTRSRIAVELMVFAAACAALMIAGAYVWAVVLAVLVVLNSVLVMRWEQ